MALIVVLLFGLIQLVMIAVDVLLVFVLLRLIGHRFNSEWLTVFNRTGAPFVDRYIAHVRKGTAWVRPGSYSEKTVLAFGLLALACVNISLNLIIKAVGWI